MGIVYLIAAVLLVGLMRSPAALAVTFDYAVSGEGITILDAVVKQVSLAARSADGPWIDDPATGLSYLADGALELSLSLRNTTERPRDLVLTLREQNTLYFERDQNTKYLCQKMDDSTYYHADVYRAWRKQMSRLPNLDSSDDGKPCSKLARIGNFSVKQAEQTSRFAVRYRDAKLTPLTSFRVASPRTDPAAANAAPGSPERIDMELTLELVYTYRVSLPRQSEAPLVIRNVRGLADEHAPCGGQASASLSLHTESGKLLPVRQLVAAVASTEDMDCQAVWSPIEQKTPKPLKLVGRFARTNFSSAINLVLRPRDQLELSCRGACGGGQAFDRRPTQRALGASSVRAQASQSRDGSDSLLQRFEPAQLFDGNPLTPWCPTAEGSSIGQWVEFELLTDTQGCQVDTNYAIGQAPMPGLEGEVQPERSYVKQLELKGTDGSSLGMLNVSKRGERAWFPDVRLPKGRYRATIRAVFPGKTAAVCLGEFAFIPTKERELFAAEPFVQQALFGTSTAGR